jgi:hypothetical protein
MSPNVVSIQGREGPGGLVQPGGSTSPSSIIEALLASPICSDFSLLADELLLATSLGSTNTTGTLALTQMSDACGVFRTLIASGQRVQAYAFASSAPNSGMYLGQTREALFETRIQIPVLATVGEDFAWQWGVCGTSGATNTNFLVQSNGFTAIYDRSVSPNWILQVASLGALTQIPTDEPVTTAWTKLRLRRIYDSATLTGRNQLFVSVGGEDWRMIADTTERVMLGDNVNNGAVMWRTYKKAGAVQVVSNIDYVKALLTWNNPR